MVVESMNHHGDTMVTIVNIVNVNVHIFNKNILCEDDYPIKCAVKLNTGYVMTHDML